MSAIARPPREKLSARVITALRSDIESGRIPGGERLPTEHQLTETFQVSRTVIREAVAALAADGLVEARQGAGMFAVKRKLGAFANVAANKISIAINVLEVRMGIEIESAGLAAQRRNPSQDAAIHEAFYEFDRLLALEQATGKTDFAFHRAVAAATNNPFYVEVLDALGSRTIPCDITSPWGTDSVLTRDYQVGLQVEHARIMDAISAQDVAAARDAMRKHLSNSQDRYRARLRKPDVKAPVPTRRRA
jgi:GntR family transcriptional repressor for pyruvate dehydrogenase complex